MVKSLFNICLAATCQHKLYGCLADLPTPCKQRLLEFFSSHDQVLIYSLFQLLKTLDQLIDNEMNISKTRFTSFKIKLDFRFFVHYKELNRKDFEIFLFDYIYILYIPKLIIVTHEYFEESLLVCFFIWDQNVTIARSEMKKQQPLCYSSTQ